MSMIETYCKVKGITIHSSGFLFYGCYRGEITGKCNCVNKKRIILGIALLAVIAIAITGCSVYLRIFGKNVVRTGDLYVKTGEAFEVSMRSLDTFLEHRNDFYGWQR